MGGWLALFECDGLFDQLIELPGAGAIITLAWSSDYEEDQRTACGLYRVPSPTFGSNWKVRQPLVVRQAEPLSAGANPAGLFGRGDEAVADIAYRADHRLVLGT